MTSREGWEWGSRASTRRNTTKAKNWGSLIHSANIDGMPRAPKSRKGIVLS